MTDLKVAFVGCGWWSSSVHAAAVEDFPGAAIDSATDPDPRRREQFAARFGVAKRYPDHRTMLAQSSPDCVVVATPHSAHASIVGDCLRDGVPVLVEKPFTLDPQDAWELVSLARQRRVPLVVGLTYTFHPYVSIVRDIISTGRLGDLVSISGSFHSQVVHLFQGLPAAYSGNGRYPVMSPLATTYSDPVTSGGGQGQTQLSHLVGLLLAELPTELTDVTARMTWLKPGTDVAVAAAMRTADGVAVSLVSSGALRDADDRVTSLRFDGTKGWLVHDALHGHLRASAGVLRGIEIPAAGEPYRSREPLLSLLRALGDKDPVFDDRNAVIGARTVEVIAACYRTAACSAEGQGDDRASGSPARDGCP